MTYSTLKLEQQERIATVTLTRPEKRNAISSQMIQELLAALDEVEASTARLQEIAGQSREQNMADSRAMATMFCRIHQFPKPVITAINGAAIAGGCGIATLADFALAAAEAKLGYSEVRIGFIPALVSVFLRRQIAAKHATDLLLTGRIIDAAEALRMGLITEVAASEKLMARAREIAGQLIAASPTSIARTKRLLRQFDEAAIRAEIEQAIRENADIRGTLDFREGVASFLEKREPKWTGQ
jgi:methylglutaconyl-CoA hydratase